MLTEILLTAIGAWNTFMLLYFVLINISYTALFFLGRAEVWRYVRRRSLRNYGAIADSEMSLAVSVLMPAYNEGPVIVDSVQAMLDLHYANMEVLVINDGSRDDTLEALRAHFSLVAVERVPRSALDTQDVNDVYLCPRDPRLVVIDKQNGGKADSLNAGLNYARYPLFCAVDADTLLEREALPRLVWQFQNFPDTVAVGGIVRIVNGCEVNGAMVTDVRCPPALIVRLQIVEYLRAFLVGRTGWSRLNSLLIISGAFGLFRRDLVVEVGGYAVDTVGEDAELVVRLHRHCYEHKIKHRAAFIADPVCWTQAPEDWKILSRQRNRWQRGLAECLWRHRRMMLNPRYGVIGMVALPYFLLFEAFGPVIELFGYVVFGTQIALGWVSLQFTLVMLFLAFGYGMLFSLGALYVEERSFQRYYRRVDLLRLLSAALIDNLGFRQWHTFVRAKSYWTLIRGNHAWGEMTRTNFNPGGVTVPPLAGAAPGSAAVGAAAVVAAESAA